MLKKFVPLNSNASPSKNPYEVRTYMGDTTKAPEWNVAACDRKRNCDVPHNSTISKVMTIEDELRRLHQRAKQSRFQRPFKKRCLDTDIFTMCVVPQRTPKDLRTNASAREHYIMTQQDLGMRVHDAAEEKAQTPSLVQLNSPIDMRKSAPEEETPSSDNGEEEASGSERSRKRQKRSVRPRLASPACSLLGIYVPPKKLLELKRPKSGMFHNETEAPQLGDEDVPYSTYNPRRLQQEFDEQGLQCANLIEGRSPSDLWTWNVGLQRRESDLDRAMAQAAIPRLDCDNLELALYQIPSDLHKTFVVEIVYGNDAIRHGNDAIRPEQNKKKRYFNRPMEIACIYVAFVETFGLNPDFWKAEHMDGIFPVAAKLLKKSTDINYKSPDTDFDILPQLNERQAVVNIKAHFTGPLRDEPNIYKVLSLYFQKYSAAVLCTHNMYLLIWKICRNSFYIYDPNGRNELCQRDFDKGRCTLVTTRYVEHLVHLIVNFSDANMDDEFTLYEISLTNFGKVTQPLSMKPAPKPTRKIWAVVNGSFAIIPAATAGLQQPISGNARNASMIISLLALLYSDIERASLWQMEVLDDLTKFGKHYYKRLTKKAKLRRQQHFNIVDLPELLLMGAYRVTLQKRPFLLTGHVNDCRKYLDSQLVMALKDLFSGRWESCLLQVDNCVVAVFRDTQYFYVYDPFRRGRAGQVLDPEDYLTRGVACLQLHTTFDSLCRVLYQKALNMRRGGKFFLHGINVGCIKPVYTLEGIHNKYAHLRLTLVPCRQDAGAEQPLAPPAPPASNLKKGSGGKGKGRVKLARKYSIQSVPEAERITEYDGDDIVHDVLDDFLCDLLHSLAEPTPARPRLYKRAAKVLLQSDKTYLEALRHQLKHGQDYDNFYAAHQTEPPTSQQPLTLEEELLVASNYDTLPDGAWVIFGSTQLPALTDDLSKLAGLLSALTAAALTAKYKISTWNSQLVEFTLEAANNFGDEYQDYETLLKAILAKTLPRIAIGQQVFLPRVDKIINSTVSGGTTRSLRQVLLASLITHSRLLVLCPRFSCLLVKRFNFLYMWQGFPCSPVGYRKFGTGPACMLRFVELDALIRRIEFGCNPQGCEVTNYVIVALKMSDVTLDVPNRFLKWTRDEQEAMYRSEHEYDQKLQEHKIAKIQFLDEELRKENDRIERFLREKERRLQERRLARQQGHRPKGKAGTRGGANRSADDAGGYESSTMADEGLEQEFEDELEEEEESEMIELKHKPGRRLPTELPAKFKPRPILYGYRMRERDCMYKIQGSLALDGREETTLEEIKPCFFVSALAILYAILRPLNQWNSQRVDRVVDGGRGIALKVSNMTTAMERIIRNVTVDDYEFDVLTKTFEPAGVWGAGLRYELAKATSTRRYLLLQLGNCTYAIYRDEFYHLFDAYGSMTLTQEQEAAQSAEQEQVGARRCLKGLKRYGERDTASWVLFADVEALLAYIDKRATNPNWQADREFQMHVLDVLSYKRAAAPARVLQLMTDLAVPATCPVEQHGVDETDLCAHNESLSWLELEHCLPIWSRMHRRNTAGRYRNLPVTKLKKFDIEIDGRLWSLWGNLHPQAPVFATESRGRQYLACCVVACCAVNLYPLVEWTSHLLDTIVISGDKYHRESLANIKQRDYEFSLEDLNLELTLENLRFVVHLEHVAYGKLYSVPTDTRMNLAEALMYFFSFHGFGVLQCQQRVLAIGRTLGHDGGYFMYDCQSRDHPLFPKGQGAAYLLRSKHLQVLLYCVVVTLNIPFYNVDFTIHKVDLWREGASAATDEGEEEDGDA